MDAIFIQMLFLVSVLTGLVTEAIKKLFDEMNIAFHPTFIAMISSIILSIGIYEGNMILQHMSWDSENIVMLIALVFMSWLGSTCGFDKIKDILK